MSIYIVKHDNKIHQFVLKDEYHKLFLKYVRESGNLDILNETIRQGILNKESIDYTDDLPYNIARDYQVKAGVWSSPLWWYIDTKNMTYRLIPQY